MAHSATQAQSVGDESAAPPGYSWYVLAILVIAYAIYNFDKTIPSILIEPIKAEFGLSDSQISLLAGLATSAPFAIACIPLGMLADRVSRKRLLVVLIAGWSLMTGAAGLATTTALLFISRIGVGAFESGYAPIGMSVTSDYFPRRLRPTALGIFALGAPFGSFLAMSVGGLVAHEFGWRAAFFVAGVPGLVAALVIGVTVREPARGQFDVLEDRTKPALLMAVIANMWRERALFYVVLGMLFSIVVLSVLSIWTPSFLIRIHGMELRQAGLWSSLVIGIAGALGAGAGGMAADFFGRNAEWRKLVVPVIGILISTLVGTTVFLADFGNGPTLVLLAMTAFFGQVFIGTGYSFVANLSPLPMRATTVSVLLVFINLTSHSMGSLFAGVVSDHLAPTVGVRSIGFGAAASYVFSVIGAVFFLRAIFILRARRA